MSLGLMLMKRASIAGPVMHHDDEARACSP